jgi:uncharacterized protein YggT (Ycf19 family)
MPILDFILNLVGLLLWVSWRSARLDPLVTARPATLVGTVRRAEPQPWVRWQFLLGLASLLFFRAVLYWQIGPAADWTPTLNLGAITLSFRSDLFLRVLAFSVASFVLMVASFYFFLLFLSAVNGPGPEAEPVQKFVRFHLGWLDRWPWLIKLMLPFILLAGLWLLLLPLVYDLQIVPRPLSLSHRFEQAGTIGLGVYLNWKYLITGFLGLYTLSSYVFIGEHPFWGFITVSSRRMLTPFRFLPLRIGKVDFAPLIAIALTVMAAQYAERGLTALYRRLPI